MLTKAKNNLSCIGKFVIGKLNERGELLVIQKNSFEKYIYIMNKQVKEKIISGLRGASPVQRREIGSVMSYTKC